MKLLDRVHLLLSQQQVPHALVGAAALAARGIARSTFDVDLLTTDARVLDRTLWQALSTGGVTVEIRRGDSDDPLGGVVRLEEPGARPVDVVLGKEAWQRDVVLRAESLAGGGPRVVTAADLILLKLYAGGAQDLWDIRELLTLPDADVVRRHVESGLNEQPAQMREAWKRAAGTA